ncbi:MAG: DUF4296 domain-containing protein [Bacteroidales bacterium]|nr:DUF4296 domain-containing protein [Bacteroidales bacterium]
MRRGLSYLLLALVVLGCLLPSCRRARIIGVSDMADIYAEMFLADQWLNDNSAKRRKADTTQFYGAIFARHGYDFRDYDASVNYYLAKPEKYNQVLKKAVEKLKSGLTEVEEFEKAIERQNKILAGLSALHLPVFAPDSILHDTALLWIVRDSVSLDSLALDSLRLDTLRLDSLRLDSLRPDSLRPDLLKRFRPVNDKIVKEKVL